MLFAAGPGDLPQPMIQSGFAYIADHFSGDFTELTWGLIGATVLEGEPRYFREPTPGQANGSGVLNFVEELKATVGGNR